MPIHHMHHDPDALAQAVLAAVRSAGCTCTEPVLELQEHTVHGVWAASVAHDPGCALLARRCSAWN